MGAVTLDQIRRTADGDFPRELLVGCDTALVLFAAAFLGRQDAIFVADAELTATCVDTDPRRLAEMRAVYPVGWEFVEIDAFTYAERTARRWDIVSVDCPTGAFGRCAELIELWCSLARVAVVLGTGISTQLRRPDGWRLTDMRHRSDFKGGVYWAVIERANLSQCVAIVTGERCANAAAPESVTGRCSLHLSLLPVDESMIVQRRE